MNKPKHGPKVQCVHCKDIIQSMYTHDFRWCKCKKIAIDGGGSYTKMTYHEPGDYVFIDTDGKFIDRSDG